MKSARLLSLLMLLQTHGRLRTSEVARRLEVSPRTVMRDVEALSEAGVPVYTERGRNGGIALLSGFRIDLSQLNSAELSALMLGGLGSSQLAELGVSGAYDIAQRKLATKLTEEHRDISRFVVTDTAPWMCASGEHDLADLVADIRLGHKLEIYYRSSGQSEFLPRVVDPHGLAFKAGRWYLIAEIEGKARMFVLDRMAEYSVRDELSTHLDSRPLAEIWSELVATLENRNQFELRALLRRSRIDLATRILGTKLRHLIDVDEQWAEVSIKMAEMEDVRQLLQFGDHIRVLEPAKARDRMRELAEDLVANHQ